MKNKTSIKTLQNQDGQIALFIVFVIMTLLLFIALFLTNAVIKQTRVTRNNLDSIQAYYLADMGAERALYEIKNSSINPTDYVEGDNILTSNVPNLGSYTITKKHDSSPVSIKASGVFRETSRAIELSWY
jgi:Tfp pilus assembly protein PilX